MNQSQRTMQEYRSKLQPAQVLVAAKQFFTRRNSIYATFIDREGPGFVTFRGQGGEEIVIAAAEKDGATMVTGSSYLFDMQVARFFTTLPAYEMTELLLPESAAGVQA